MKDMKFKRNAINFEHRTIQDDHTYAMLDGEYYFWLCKLFKIARNAEEIENVPTNQVCIKDLQIKNLQWFHNLGSKAARKERTTGYYGRHMICNRKLFAW